MKTTINGHNWLNKELYPFEYRYVSLSAGKMHYIDEGKGEVVLFVHGTPTWSFLYRDFVKSLSKKYRCIAIDHIGFGLSDKPTAFPGRPQDHAENLTEFIHKLDLQNITLVVHDFGGPIGLGAGIANSERIDRIVMFNSWLWSTSEMNDVKKIDKMINSWLGKFLYLNMNFSPKILLKQAFANKVQLTKEAHQHYIKPFPSKESRMQLLNLAKSLAGSSHWYQEQWEQLDKLRDKEWLILWGTKDKFITTDFLHKWKAALPNALVNEFESGHFVQEEETQKSIAAIDRFMQPFQTDIINQGL